jgi:probable rRNA maturation factor
MAIRQNKRISPPSKKEHPQGVSFYYEKGYEDAWMASQIQRPRPFRAPERLFKKMAQAVLGKNYELSVVFVSTNKIRQINRVYRGKDVPTDILSFPLSPTTGEIYINVTETALQAPAFNRPFDNFLKFLFIHGLVHLNGYDHGSTMESIEAGIRAQFKV